MLKFSQSDLKLSIVSFVYKHYFKQYGVQIFALKTAGISNSNITKQSDVCRKTRLNV